MIKEKLSRGELIKMILLALGGLGIVTVAIICPNLLQLVPRVCRSPYRSRIIRQAILRLDKRGLIIAQRTEDGWKIQLTKKGREELMKYELKEKHLKKRKHWDGIWHLLIFDIPEKRRWVRDRVRQLLQQFDFQRLQDSVWVYPYECREVLDLLRTRYHIRSEALYVKATTIDNDHWLQKHFSLKK
ncbi:CRISPR-associated endonuclease Cas2 [Candidatus Uhrbacteria bacterium]|nr:CRISPR-associated endonuclease Cas2 [Candidatus Uhrbacteria bacterium]